MRRRLTRTQMPSAYGRNSNLESETSMELNGAFQLGLVMALTMQTLTNEVTTVKVGFSGLIVVSKKLRREGETRSDALARSAPAVDRQ